MAKNVTFSTYYFVSQQEIKWLSKVNFQQLVKFFLKAVQTAVQCFGRDILLNMISYTIFHLLTVPIATHPHQHGPFAFFCNAVLFSDWKTTYIMGFVHQATKTDQNRTVWEEKSLLEQIWITLCLFITVSFEVKDQFLGFSGI